MIFETPSRQRVLALVQGLQKGGYIATKMPLMRLDGYYSIPFSWEKFFSMGAISYFGKDIFYQFSLKLWISLTKSS